MEILHFTVSAAEAGQRLDKFLSQKISGHSRGEIQNWIKAGSVLISGRTVKKTAAIIEKAEQIEVHKLAKQLAIRPEVSVKFEVIAVEKDFIIVNKPAGLVVHPGSGHISDTLVNGLMARFPEIAGVGEDPQRPGIVHRLDKETAGVIVVARTQAGYDHLKSQFKNRQVEKTYLALVESALDKDHGVIKGYMKRSSHIPVKRELDDEAEGKFSQTTYRVLEKVGDCTLVEAKPQTGRMHQLRVHFSALGHPIVGDTLYGRREQPGPLMLLAWKIRFKDSGGVWREYEVPVDSNFAS